MNKLKIILILFWWPVAAFAGQTANDSIEALMNSNAPDSVKFVTLILHAHKIHSLEPYTALKYASEAYRLGQKARDKRIAVAALAMGRICMSVKDYKSALHYFHQALNGVDAADRTDKLIHKNFRAETCMNLGQLYSDLMQYDESYLYYRKALDECARYQIRRMPGVISLNMGTMFQDKKENDSALAYYRKALQIARSNNDSNLTGGALINLASLCNDIGMVNEAQAYASEMLSLNTAFNNLRNMAYTHNVLGEVGMKKQQWKTAEKHLLLSLELADSIDDKKLILNVLKDLSVVNERLNRPLKALEYERQAFALNDSTYKNNLEHQLAEMNVQFNTERKNKEIERLSHEKTLTAMQLENTRFARNMIIVAMMLVLMLFAVSVIAAKSRQRMNRKLASVNSELLHTNSLLEENNVELAHKNKVISDQKKEIEMINMALSNYNNKLIDENITAKYEVLKSKVNPHFLFNSLSTLSSLVTESEELSLEYISRFADLYRMILETGEVTLLKLGEEKRIVESYLYLQQMEYENKLEISIAIPAWAEEYLIPPFAVQMSVENAIKHNIVTSRNKLFVSITVSEDREVIIRNNLQAKANKPHSTRTGQKNISGRYSLVSRNMPTFSECGNEYIVVLPLLEKPGNITAGTLSEATIPA